MPRLFLRSLLLLLGLSVLSGCVSMPLVSPLLWRTGLWCGGDRADRAAAGLNAAGLSGPTINVFGRPEAGWVIYAPAIQATIGARCPPQTPGFAAALAHWRERRGLAPIGVLDAETLAQLKTAWQARRPFVTLREQGVCPDPPPDDAMEVAAAQESLSDKPIRLRRGALEAYRRMVAAARRAGVASTNSHPVLLALFSGYRDPVADAARCVAQADCQGLVRAACSAHRTGLALDLSLGAAPGYALDNSADPNRLYQTRTPAYLWLTRNAARYGFVNYVFEPWHWEWTGEAP